VSACLELEAKFYRLTVQNGCDEPENENKRGSSIQFRPPLQVLISKLGGAEKDMDIPESQVGCR
jgi:hypothetical protein